MSFTSVHITTFFINSSRSPVLSPQRVSVDYELSKRPPYLSWFYLVRQFTFQYRLYRDSGSLTSCNLDAYI